MRRLLALVLFASLLLPHASLAAQAAGTGPDAGTLQPGDLLRVQIWREEDLSGEFLVDENGVVTLPLLGEKKVTGVQIARVRDMLIEGYRVQLRNPSINIIPLRRVHVLGEVQKPGLYTVDLTVSLAGVVALAGGATEAGDLQRVRIVRNGTVTHDRVGVVETVSTLGVLSGDHIFVDRRSWLERNASALLVSGASFIGSLITTLIVIASTK